VLIFITQQQDQPRKAENPPLPADPDLLMMVRLFMPSAELQLDSEK
jgi:hypothetical protein